MELRHLRYFCAVAQELNFTRAAKKLFIAQPPLTRQIKNLEAELGTELFDRQARGLALTAAGHYFYAQAINILQQVDQAKSNVEQIAKDGRTLLNIGFVPSVFYGPLPEVIQKVEKEGNVKLTLTELKTQEQIAALQTGEIDIGFGRLIIEDANVKQDVLYRESICVAVSENHVLTAKNSVSLEDLVAHPMVLYPSGKAMNLAEIFQGFFLSNGLQVNIIQQVGDLQTALALVGVNVGFTLVPELVTLQQRDGICFLPLSDKSISSPVICSYLGQNASLKLQRFLSQLRELISTADMLRGKV